MRRTFRNSGRRRSASTTRSATTPRRCSLRPLNRTCGSWLECPSVPIGLAMPVADPEHQQAQCEGNRAEIKLRAHGCFVAPVSRNECLIQCRETVHFRQMLERLIDCAQRLLLPAVVVAQDVACADGVVLQV